MTQWETLDIFDPHHPFLLDELQWRLSFACQRLAGIPPLLEIHQDGRLFMLLPNADSANQDNRVLPVRAAVNYSDALSLLPKDKCVDEAFHNRAMEDGTLFDAESKKNSDNLFTRHFIKPGTLMVQVLSTRGQVLPEIGLKHLLLCVGMAGSYGGQTSVAGINIRTHVVGMYGGKFEQAITSPYDLLRELKDSDAADVMAAKAGLHKLLQPVHQVTIQGSEVEAWQSELIESFNQSGSELEGEYKQAQPKVAALFDQWFQ